MSNEKELRKAMGTEDIMEKKEEKEEEEEVEDERVRSRRRRRPTGAWGVSSVIKPIHSPK